jgi:glycosyltransferase involved in cell wall biosynthesis
VSWDWRSGDPNPRAMGSPRATIQICTYNRAHLLGRVLDACFEQTAPFDAYEVVLVNDGSTDETPLVIEAARSRATCAFTVVAQANAGLARARNAGIARASGERIIFIDDDVLPTPPFVAEHLRSGERAPQAIVRGGVINTESFDVLPPPIWTIANYSGNFFWTTNVSIGRSRLDAVGPFTESFREYGWEDIELGLRLRHAGARSLLNPRALAYHFKPPPRARNVDGMVAQARAQARTARELYRLHPHWRVVLATGDHPIAFALHALSRRLLPPERLARRIGERASERVLSRKERGAARALARDAYYDELAAARAAGD